MAKWEIKNEKADIKLMCETLGISSFISQILVNRGIRTKNSCIKFLNPSSKFLNDASNLLGIKEAISKLLKNSNIKIAIYGDYDVDGVMSTVILHKGLSAIFKDLIYYIPQRDSEGYGLNNNAIRQLYLQGVNLIIACDTGITAIEEVALANSLGMEVIIIDHHETIIERNNEILPDAIIVNPKQKNCAYPFKEICAAGLCFKFINELYKSVGMDITSTFFNENLAFAAIATLCDVVELTDENRIIVRLGLNILTESQPNIGIKLLMKYNKLENINEEAIGYTIGPCINATGRLSSATIAVTLFLENNEKKAAAIAKEIIALNEQRKNLTSSAFNIVYDKINENDNVIVIYTEDIHESVAGIIAGRIKEKVYKPTIIITNGENFAKGSARSIEGYNIYYNLSKCRHLFHKFGGHKMAAGFSLLKDDIPALKTALNKDFKGGTEKTITIDFPLSLEMVTYTLVKEMDILRPFGKNNEAPIFLTKGVKISQLRVIKEKDTLIFTFLTDDERSIKGICFGETKRFEELITNNYDNYNSNKILNGVVRTANLVLDIVYCIELNSYNGLTSLQLKIKDFKLSR